MPRVARPRFHPRLSISIRCSSVPFASPPGELKVRRVGEWGKANGARAAKHVKREDVKREKTRALVTFHVFTFHLPRCLNASQMNGRRDLLTFHVPLSTGIKISERTLPWIA